MNGTHLALLGIGLAVAFLPTLDLARLLARIELWHCRWALRQMDIRHHDWAHVRARIIDLALALGR